ncbi:hypothetical protein N8532_02330 [Akkermansiaceae bacterium]|nr:hypothetical protein [Akkermansiaceae bacterium]MDB4608326.1 hypothetical protein [bacterium]
MPESPKLQGLHRTYVRKQSVPDVHGSLLLVQGGIALKSLSLIDLPIGQQDVLFH